MIAAILALLCAAVQDPRPPWTTSRVHGTPDDPPPYRTELAFPKLRFREAVDILQVPGSDRLAVARLGGTILTLTNRESEPAATMLQFAGYLLGMAFHPRFTENGYLYAVVAVQGTSYVEVMRYTIVDGKAKPGSATVILQWPFTHLLTHLGGALRFGPDGFLYIGIGDGHDGNYSPRPTGQDTSDLESSILRIDVDHPSAGRRYGIPRDNPFVNVRGTRPEIWAFGLRQPWKMSFDSLTGDLWVGDVGETLRESIFRVRRGGNYGWCIMEGGLPVLPGKVSDLSPISPPVVVHPHTEFRSITGGVVYRGTRFPELVGSYVYGDYETGKIWEVRLEGEKIVRHRELASTSLRIIAFSESATGELLVLDHPGELHRLVPNTGASRNVDFPRTLSATGLFVSVRDHRPAAGVVPYSVNAALWSDGADKERFIALPGSSRIRPDSIPNLYVQVPGANTYDFPDGTVLVKTFSIGGKRIETRLLHLTKKADNSTIQGQEWRGYTYRWNGEQTDADLVDAAGLDVEVTRPEQAGKQTWRYPSRTECLQCHTMAAHFVLGVLTTQLDRVVDIPGQGKVNQIEWFKRIGLLDRPPRATPPLADYEQKDATLEMRARSYLQANCAHCHVPLGGGNSAFQVHGLLPLDRTGLVDVAPLHGDLGLPDARLVAPGSPERSVLVHRMGMTGAGRMPPLSSHVVDEAGIRLVSEWIRQMPPVPKAEPLGGMRGVLLSGAAAVLLVVGVVSVRRFRRAR